MFYCVSSLMALRMVSELHVATSHFSVHTWPEYGYAAVDIFSCTDEVVAGIAEILKTLFGAEKIVMRSVQREIAPEPGTPAEAADTEKK